VDPACTEADLFALAGRGMVSSFEPDAERECTSRPLIHNLASFISFPDKFFPKFRVVSVALATFGRAALPDITGPCLVKMDTQGSDATILAGTRCQLAASVHETGLTASREPPGMQAGIGRLNMSYPRRAPELPPRDHPAIRHSHTVRR
jgi:hypothetical protein